MDIFLYKSLWQSNSPRRVNLSIWIMQFEYLNCASVLQRKLLSHALSPHIYPLCVDNLANIQNFLNWLFLHLNCGSAFSKPFNICWVFYQNFKKNATQILAGPTLKKKAVDLLWVNEVKDLLVEVWFERNQRVFHDRPSIWMERYDSACLNATSWYSLSKISRILFAGDFVKLVSFYSFSTLKSSDIMSSRLALYFNSFLLNRGLIFICSQPAAFLLLCFVWTVYYYYVWPCICGFFVALVLKIGAYYKGFYFCVLDMMRALRGCQPSWDAQVRLLILPHFALFITLLCVHWAFCLFIFQY